ncbi:hypothetical protein Nham_2379 [Nitrobacter hamburgensis X14]|uniref:DUF4376 domain-containing protein n=1 Tax=Nitrobacter hamburgensis (strain DSM 10229 / NCIMB 13809 / X14) TaxID=323097 RepID=Q1QKS7_NITHX|nr:DUF4376 domain-containing protein [Nitrobacter hamburgensis]ABE63170.1 hypothetical protein Nham_2379 [Nitrobacter hamburgensis X14]
MRYNPLDWYWLADDGRVYSSAQQARVPDDDAAWLVRQGSGAWTPWPRDEAGEQTDAALQWVLAPYGLFVDLLAYAADARWRREVGGITVAGVSVATDDRSKQMIIGARIAADADSNWSTSWVAADGSIVPVNATTIIAISDAVQAHVNDCFTAYALVKADIDSGEITTIAEIDAAFAA